MKELLLLDCYLSLDGCPTAFTPPEDVETRVLQAAHVGLTELELDLSDFSGMVITGSAASVLAEEPWSLAIEQLIHSAHTMGLPLFGVCFGHQLIAKTLFGELGVRRSPTPEFGWHKIRVASPEGPVAETPQSFLCFLSHYDEVTEPPAGDMQVLARTERCAVQAFTIIGRPIWGVQFHAEMDFDEASSIFRERVGNSPELGIDTQAMLELAVPTPEIWATIYMGFLELVRKS
jgi:GMP synthase (glutamine-hydrolysing)